MSISTSTQVVDGVIFTTTSCSFTTTPKAAIEGAMNLSTIEVAKLVNDGASVIDLFDEYSGSVFDNTCFNAFCPVIFVCDGQVSVDREFVWELEDDAFQRMVGDLIGAGIAENDFALDTGDWRGGLRRARRFNLIADAAIAARAGN